jgi:hypothetical protein
MAFELTGYGKERARQHEMKHAIDNIIGEPFILAKELSAHFFADPEPRKDAFDRSLKYDYNRMKNCPPDIKEKIETYPLSIVNQIVESGMSLREVSYAVSTTPMYEVPMRLMYLRNYLQANPKVLQTGKGEK